MKIIIPLAIMLISSLTFAQDMNYNCRPLTKLSKSVNVGGDKLIAIEKLTGRINGRNPNIEFALSGKLISEMQIVNRQGNEKLVPENFTDKFVLNDARTGMMLDLKSAPESNNQLNFIYTIMNMHSFDVNTAGPIPEGTWNQKVDLILITPQASTHTINFNCKVDVKY